MIRRTEREVVAAVLVTAVLLSGCGVRQAANVAAKRQQVAYDLKAIGLMYHEYNFKEKKGPDKVEDLQPYASSSPTAYQGLVDGRFVFIWGVKLTDMTEGTSNTVIGYEKDVPIQGGNVLFGDGSVRHMTADAFKQQPKAQPPKK